MIMTTLTNRYKKVGVTASKIRARQLSMVRRNRETHVAACAFHSSQIVIAHYQSFILQMAISVRGRDISEES